MSNLSFMEKLLQGVEVEWKTLGEVAELKRGRVMSKIYLAENHGNFPVYSSQTANNGQIGKISSFDFNGEFVSWTTDGANAGTVFHRTGKFSITNVCGLIRINNEEALNYKFLFYWLSIEAKKHVYSGMGNPKLMSHQVSKIPIPILPLNIQSEIVHILDNFTELTVELTVELTARKKQYNYYRDKLLSFEEGEVEVKKLGEVTKIQRGKRLVKNDLEEFGNYAVFQNSMKPLGYYHEGNVLADTTFIISAGAAGEIGYSNIDFWAADDIYYFITSKILINKFLYYFLLTQQVKITSQVRRASVPRLSKTAFVNLQIPIPPLAEQKRIVSILDKFDTLTNSISEGLPKEIELREKQYEYYRNLLLTFKKGIAS